MYGSRRSPRAASGSSLRIRRLGLSAARCQRCHVCRWMPWRSVFRSLDVVSLPREYLGAPGRDSDVIGGVFCKISGARMFGQRRRIGYIAPTVIEVVAYEFYRFAPEGIGLTGVTCSIDDWRPEELEKGLAQVAAAATYLGSRGVDFIIHCGGPLVVARGPGDEDRMR